MLEEDTRTCLCPDGGTGRRARLKIWFSQESPSSTLGPGTIQVPIVGRNPVEIDRRNPLTPCKEITIVSTFRIHERSRERYHTL